MQWLWQNWFAVLIFAAFIAMHLFGHGGHGGHGRRQERPDTGKEGSKGGGQEQHHPH
jgi:hypothetical protein